MKKLFWRLLCCFLLMSAVVCASIVAPAGQSTPIKESNAESIAVVSMTNTPGVCAVPSAWSTRFFAPTSRGASFSAEDLQELLLYPGGMPFGVKFFTEGVTVVGFCDVETEKGKVNPATAAGLKAKDVILEVNGEVLRGATQLNECIESSGGAPLTLHCRRKNTEFDTTLTPAYCPAEEIGRAHV